MSKNQTPAPTQNKNQTPPSQRPALEHFDNNPNIRYKDGNTVRNSMPPPKPKNNQDSKK
jgi:hypothetical protein